MGFGIDIGIDPKRHRRDNAQLPGQPVNPVQFAADFNIKTAYADL